jgi:hypothetical protein
MILVLGSEVWRGRGRAILSRDSGRCEHLVGQALHESREGVKLEDNRVESLLDLVSHRVRDVVGRCHSWIWFRGGSAIRGSWAVVLVVAPYTRREGDRVWGSVWGRSEMGWEAGEVWLLRVDGTLGST